MSWLSLLLGMLCTYIGVGEGLTLGGGRCGCKLRCLQAVVQPQCAQIYERWQDPVDAVVEEIIQLPLGQHG